MAERKFDYDAVKGVYDGMKGINEQIKTLLVESDTEVESKVSVVDEALYGDLGTQMLLNWENISSNFPDFIDNFENWAALVAKASGNYQQFEKDVAGFKEDNPYGAASGGLKASYVSTSSYNDSKTAEQIEELDAQRFIYEETDPVYIDTGMVKQAKVTKALNIFTDIMNVVGIATAGAAIFKAVKAVPAVASIASSSVDDVGTGVTRAVASNVDDTSRSVANTITQNVDDTSRSVANTITQNVDDVAKNTPIQQRIDDMVGISKPAANTQGAPTVNNSALAQATDDQLFMYRANAGVNSPVQQRIDALTGVSQPPASSMGAPTASNSAFAQPNTALQNQIDDIVGISKSPASMNGAPTANNSAFAQATDEQLYMYRANAGVNSPVQQRIDALTGVSQPPASSMGAPTVSDSAFYADNLTGKFNKFTNQVHAKTDAFGQKFTDGLRHTKDNVVQGLGNAKDNVVQGLGNAKDNVVQGLGKAKDGLVKGAQITGSKVKEGYDFTKAVATEAGINNIKNVSTIGGSGASATVLESIRDNYLDSEN